MDAFESCLNKYIQPSDSELNIIRNFFQPQQIKAGKKLVTPNRKNTDLIYIEKGCLRVYFKLGQKEFSGLFVFEEDFFRDLSSLIAEFEFPMYVEALEDTCYMSITRQDLEKLIKEVPVFEIFINKSRERMIRYLVNTIIAQHAGNAEQRYQKLLEHPKLLKRVPLKYLASYLGITTTSLSRLRGKK